jgi:hypothetical protein
MIFNFSIISFIIVQLLNLRKSLGINKFIFIRLLPLKIIIVIIFYMFTGGFEGICPWNILEDTRYSDNFNVYNINKVEIGMGEDKVIELIGDPYFPYSNDKNTNGEYRQYWTSDGKSNFGDFAWLEIIIKFKNNKVDDINIQWVYD